MEQVILVDTKDNEKGVMEKLEAHHKGALHRAFSVLLFNPKGELLIQRRADHKYHSAGLWSNTCCSHPRPKENNTHAVTRRLGEEMGLRAETSHLYSFIYKYEFNSSMIEHELDHVFIGETSHKPQLNPDEASDWRWISWNELRNEIEDNESSYTFWFKQILAHLMNNPLILPTHLRPFK